MRIVFLLFGLSCILSPLSAQQAPDFTVTDIHGEQHQLYADYLNQGKTVLIKVFFTTCPPCNSIAPFMEPFYQEWGAGAFDVEFFEMTDKTFDTDALVTDYANNYNETFPAISKDGGAIETVQPYKSGTFGPWFGTPTFIVIAPDGSVQYNVDGQGNQATINALDEAIEATGAIKPGTEEQPVVLSGGITFLEGTTGVGGVVVELVDANDQIISADTSAQNGSFNISYLESEVEPGWKLRAHKNGPHGNGVSATDMLRVQKHLIHVEYLSPIALLAADANNSSSNSTLDVVVMLKLLLGHIPEFPDGRSWIVFPSDTDFGPPSQHTIPVPSNSIPFDDILDGTRPASFIAIKRGDVNGTADPN